MSHQYTNELTPEILSEIEQFPFTPEQLADMSDEARSLIEEQKAFNRAHPMTAIYRIAVAGCLTARGGIGDESNPNPEEGYKILLEKGQWVSVLTEGSTVTYPDGSCASIVSSAGNQHTYEGRGIALVNSLLSNGDRIISTSQSTSMLAERKDVPMGDDFLAVGNE